MRVWRQLRWQILGSHLVIVLAGVLILLLTTEIIQIFTTPADIQIHLTGLIIDQSTQQIEQAAAELLTTFRQAIFIALAVAASGAAVASLITTVLLTRLILRPLEQLTQSSRRIANGHYDERVAVPDSLELARVATYFNQMAEALEHVEQQRIALIGNVSHELRTPLAGVEGYLEGLIDGLFPDNTKTFAQMYQEVRRLRRLVNDLQELSRVEAGQVSLHLERFSLSPLIERIVDQLQPQAIAKELQVNIVGSDQPLMAYADPDRTAQIALNLIGNAIRYTPEGGWITITGTAQRGQVQIVVQDSGIGMPPESLPYIFERFYRVDTSRARSSGGSGIGLTISRHLAWAMRGDLSGSSPGLNQGSTFTLSLPDSKSNTA